MRINLKEQEAFFLKTDGMPGLKRFRWDVPIDLSIMAKKKEKTFIGIGRWKITNELFVCISSHGKNSYLDEGIFRGLMVALDKIGGSNG